MRDWTLMEAKKDFERGLLKEARIVPIESGLWAVQITSTLAADGTGWLLQTKRREQRQMKTLQAAAEAVTNIGFKIRSLLIET
ncbi:hypothetical protein P245_05370 [Comamonas thiooxydans]|uniref:Uncharacterized protein n=1 Tax=Comamonas thiooxydans TaxID=363952 RepID=A0A0E3C6P2_9BURK|nr:hypothetical protein [Comamonas thiooxydans]KGG96616.1 hypothetical protein P245_05370 [Comamonas thiooxydans]